jgi:hypothetical protein
VRLLLALGILLMVVGIAAAGEVEERQQKIAKLGERRVKADAERKKLATAYAAKTREVQKLKGQRKSWSRDDKLKQRLAEARDMAAKLDKRAAEVRILDQALRGERQALVKAIDAELPNADAARQNKLRKLRADAVSRLPRKVRVADEEVDPLDDPDDLDAKARALAQSERELADEEKKLAGRVAYYRKQARLKRAQVNATQDPFNDDTPRRKGGNGQTTEQGREDDDNGAGITDASPPAPGEADGFTMEPDDADPAAVYEDVVEPETAEALRKAERSGDPESRARAAERARKDVVDRAARLKKKRLEIERRARELRGE